MIGYDIEIEGLEEQLKKLIAYDEITDRHLYQAMKQSVLSIQSQVTPLVPVGSSSRLRNSIGSSFQPLSTSLIGRVGTSLKDEIYPQVMEFGRAPGTMPPVSAIAFWVHRRRLAGVYSIKKSKSGWRARLGSKDQQEREDYAVAWSIAKKIKKHGIKGRFFMKTGFEQAKYAVLNYFSKALEKIAEDLSNDRK